MAQVTLSHRRLGLPGRSARRWLGAELLRNVELVTAGGVLVLVVAACFLWPLVYHLPSPTSGNPVKASLPVGSPGHLLGTNVEGIDMLSRVLYGGRVSLAVGAGATLLGMVVGGLVGAFSGYRGGVVDLLVMRAVDVLIAIPSLVLVLVFAEFLGAGELNVIWAIAFFNVAAFARLARAGALRVAQQPFVMASQVGGTKRRRVLFFHVVPNVLPQLVTFSFLSMAVNVLLEAALSYLGLGVQPPNPSWGNMISDGQSALSSMPSLVIIPSVFLLVTSVCLNLVGDALRAREGGGR